MRRKDFVDAMDVLKDSSGNFNKLVNYSNHLLLKEREVLDTAGLVEDLEGRVEALVSCVGVVKEAFGLEETPEEESFDFEGGNPGGPDDGPTNDALPAGDPGDDEDQLEDGEEAA